MFNCTSWVTYSWSFLLNINRNVCRAGSCPAHSRSLAKHQVRFYYGYGLCRMTADIIFPFSSIAYLVLQFFTFTCCVLQQRPGRFWPLCWPSLVLLSAWLMHTWRCRQPHTSHQSLCHILTFVSAPRWVSHCLHLYTPVSHNFKRTNRLSK